MKQPFIPAVHDLVKQNQGSPIIGRQEIREWADVNNVSLPASLKQHKVVGERGMIDLTFYLQDPSVLFTKASAVNGHAHSALAQVFEPEPEATDEDLLEKISQRFDTLDVVTYGMVSGGYRGVIVSGNPGIGKTYTMEYILDTAQEASKVRYKHVRGYLKATGLFKLMYEYRFSNDILLIDDADSIFNDETGLNILKAGLDTTKRRMITWGSEKKFELEDGEQVPREFQYDGAIGFITNINFVRMISVNQKLKPHLEALMSRSMYLDLNLSTTREVMLRIESVCEHTDILKSRLNTATQRKTVMSYVRDNQNRMRELSLRTVIQLTNIIRASDSVEQFKMIADQTLLHRAR